MGILSEGARNTAKTGVDFANEALKRQDDLLKSLTGVYSGQAGTTTAEAQAQLQAAQQAQDAWKALMQNETEKQRIAQGTASSQLDALIRLAGMI